MSLAAEGTAPNETINLPVRPDIQHLIDRAADLTGKTRTEFILEAARIAAVNALLNRCFIDVDDETYNAFLKALDAPPTPSPALQRLMQTKAPWERA